MVYKLFRELHQEQSKKRMWTRENQLYHVPPNFLTFLYKYVLNLEKWFYLISLFFSFIFFKLICQSQKV